MSSYPIDTKVPPFDPRCDLFFEIMWCCIVRDTLHVQLTKAMAYTKPKWQKQLESTRNCTKETKLSKLIGHSPCGNNEVLNPLWRLRSGATPVAQGITSLRMNKASLAGNKVGITTIKVSKRGGGRPPVLVHLVILPTLLTGLRGRTVEALGRMCFVRAGTCDTLKRGVWAGATLHIAGRGGTSVVPSGVGASAPAAVGCIGAA